MSGDPIQLRREYEALTRMQGGHTCRVIAFDSEAGLLLEERILPGTSLRFEASLEGRVRVLAQVFRAIHPPRSRDETYLDWLDSAHRFCAADRAAAPLAEKAALARSICAEMFQKYPEHVLLHGDLHHDNILLCADGRYAVIDPKGVVGPPILDLPRFILNEIDVPHAKPDEAHIREVIALISRRLDYPPEDVGRLFFMEAVLANIWRVEDGESVKTQELALADEIIACPI